jgi:hypothetical protein
MKTNENTVDKKPVTRQAKDDKQGDPLEKAVEKALRDQDIPVETGVRPPGSK